MPAASDARVVTLHNCSIIAGLLAGFLSTGCDVPDVPSTSTSHASTSTDSISTTDVGQTTDVVMTTSGNPTETDLTTSGGGSGGGGSSSGETGDDTTTRGEPTGETCYAAKCLETGCAEGLICAPHPVTQELMCVTTCGPPFACNEALLKMCGEPVKVECHLELDTPLCFPPAED